MKNAISIVLFLLTTAGMYCQQGINYKAVIKDGDGMILSSSPVSIQFIIYEGAALTNNVYQETHVTTTDANGLIIVNIGEGVATTIIIEGLPFTYVFTDIDWGSDAHFLNTQIDTGAGLVDMGTTGFKMVPYALHAENGVPSDGTEGQVLTIVGGIPTWSTPPPRIGDLRDGGIVFYIDETDDHGLVCALTDAPTALIRSEAIDYCDNYTNPDTGIGVYSDWYLPNLLELEMIYANLQRFGCETNWPDNSLCPTRTGNFALDFYWSSGFLGDRFWLLDFEDGSPRLDWDFPNSVRAVRAF